MSECFSCSNEVRVGDGEPLDATPFTGSPGFGSDFDGAGELEIIVCDPCLTERSSRITRTTVTNVTTVHREAWSTS